MALPSGYRHIEYLESQVSQYLNLQCGIAATDSVTIDIELLSENRNEYIFGVNDGNTNFFYYFYKDFYNSTNRWGFFLNTGYDSGAVSLGNYQSGRHILKTEYNGTQMIFTVDGVEVGSRLFPSGPVQSTNTTVYLFSSHSLSTSSQSTASIPAKARIYSCLLKNKNGVVIRNLVPAQRITDAALGMYDLQYGIFYTNAGSGSFVAPGISPPASLSISGDLTIGTAFTVTWGASADPTTTGYVLERSVDGAAYSSLYSGSNLYYTDTPESGWHSVQYRVAATDGTDISEYVYSGDRSVADPSAPVSHNSSEQYMMYLKGLTKPFKKMVRLEFLQPDDTVAFALGGAGQRTPVAGRDSRTFLQSGSLSVNLQNGQRRKASVVLANRDGAFDYAVNKLWFGQRVRLSMGMRLSSGEDFYLPQGVFYIQNPSALYSPGEKTITLNLTDKWSYLDGSLFGNLETAYSISSGTNIFSAMNSLLNLSKYTYEATADSSAKIDPVKAVYTDYFNNRTYFALYSDGSISSNINMTNTPYEITEERGSTFASVLLRLNEMIAGWIGYDATGALRVEPSQDDIDDINKPVLFAFTPENSILISRSETAQNGSVYNDILVAGEGLTNKSVWARAVNVDPASDTNINIIGRRVYVEEKADYWNAEQCASLARWILKRKTVLQKSVTIECGQMFHLIENRLVSVKRTDKAGSPIEKHLIQGFTIPIGETGSMSISCTSVNDLPNFTVTTYPVMT